MIELGKRLGISFGDHEHVILRRNMQIEEKSIESSSMQLRKD